MGWKVVVVVVGLSLQKSREPDNFFFNRHYGSQNAGNANPFWVSQPSFYR